MSSTNPYQPPSPSAEGVVTGTLPVRVTGLLTASDAIQALRAVGKWCTWPYYAVAIAVAVVAAMMLLPTLRWKTPPLTIAVLVVGILFLLLRPAILRNRFIKSWNARPENSSPVTWIFLEDGIFVQTSHSKLQQAWDAYLYVKITSNQIILAHHGNTMFNFVPVRFFASGEDFAAVRQLIAAKLPMR